MIRRLKSLKEFEAALETRGPLFVLKHSSTCPVSALALNEFEAMRADKAMLVVQEARELSREIAERFSIRHESPQVILFVDGKPQGVLNHEEVTVDHMTVLLSGGKTSPHSG